MTESVKASCALVLIVVCITTVFAWFTDDPDATTWGFRLGAPVIGVLAVALIVKLHFRADVVPDYLHRHAGDYFNREGFCFSFSAITVAGVCHFVAYFQNQYDQPCVGRIALRPARGFLRRPKIETVTFAIDCEPAAFGFIRIPVPLTEEVQGKRQSFEVGASVGYPRGRGKRLRFRDGIFLRANSEFGNTFATALTAAGALSGTIVLAKPAKTTIDLPLDVAENVSEGLKSEEETLWRLGDPPLDNAG